MKQVTDLGTVPRRTPRLRIVAANRLRPVVMSLMLLFAFTGGIGVDRLVLDGPDGATASTALSELPEFAIFEQTYDTIREHYIESEEVTDEELIYGASQGMVEALGDKGHSAFLTPEEAEASAAALRGELIGIGVYLDSTGASPVVIAPIDNSPAYKAGIKSGDVIVAVDGAETAELEPEDWAKRIRGDAGTDVTLRLRHEGEDQTYEVTITRAKIRVEPVSWRMLPGDIAWIKLSEFSQGATGKLIEALSEAKAQGAEAVLLDLRNNPGGYVHEALGVGAQFLPDGSVLFQEQDQGGEVTKITTPGDSGEWLDGPLMVLVNDGSASAAEIVSSALRDNGRATIIGETTFGTGTVLLPFELSDGSVVHLGTELWLTAEGDQIWKRGVEPDREVVLDEGAFPVLPIDYPGEELTQRQLSQVEDAQLKAGHESLTETLANSR